MNESSEFFVGMDVHKDSISFAVLTETSPSPVLQVRKTNTHRAVDETLDKLYGQGWEANALRVSTLLLALSITRTRVTRL